MHVSGGTNRDQLFIGAPFIRLFVRPPILFLPIFVLFCMFRMFALAFLIGCVNQRSWNGLIIRVNAEVASSTPCERLAHSKMHTSNMPITASCTYVLVPNRRRNPIACRGRRRFFVLWCTASAPSPVGILEQESYSTVLYCNTVRS